jgi:hypothetical protein
MLERLPCVTSATMQGEPEDGGHWTFALLSSIAAVHMAVKDLP